MLWMAVSLVTPLQAWQEDSAPSESLPVFDHHVHVMSPALIGHWKAAGVPFSREDAAYSDPLHILESQKLGGAFLVSMAHLYTIEDLANIDDIVENEQAWVQKENDFVAECVQKAPTRLIGFYSVNPLRDYALEEMNRCRENQELTGLKMHFPACGVDLANQDHFQKIENVFDWALEYDVPMLVHLFSADQGDPEGVADLFWKKLIQPRRSIEITLAHLGAAGGYNDVSQAVLSGFHALKTAEPIFENARIRFDLSGAVLAEELDGTPPTSPERCAALAEMIRQVGPRRFRFASDYPVRSVETTLQTLHDKLELNAEETRSLLHGKSRWFSIKKQIAEIGLPEVRRELLRRAALDQKARRGMDEKDPAVRMKNLLAVQNVDTENREWLKLQVDEHGWLGASLVGTDGAHAAWLLVQHADMDRDFQRHCLKLMSEMDEGEVILQNVAYLTDRVLVAEGKPQRYGTQFGMKDGTLQMQECEEPEKLDERRQAAGLGPIAEYKEIMEQMYRNSLPESGRNDGKRDRDQ